MHRLRSISLSATACGLASLCFRHVSRCDENHMPSSESVLYDVAIIGGGVVGLAVARACAAQAGAKAVVIEREDVVAAGTSSRNSGLGCTGYDAPVGSLERQLLRRSIRLHQNLYRSFGLSSEHVRKSGSVVVAWTPDEARQLPRILQEQREAGDEEAVILSQEELRAMEPSLSHKALGAVFCPYEAVAEPWLIPMGYAHSAAMLGVEMLTGREVTGIAFDKTQTEWVISTLPSNLQSVSRSSPNRIIVPAPAQPPLSAVGLSEGVGDAGCSPVRAKVVINCAGLYGDCIEKYIATASASSSLGEGKEECGTSNSIDGRKFTITPRKGQFIVYRLSDGDREDACSSGVIIEPVATPFTKGVIVWKTLYGNVIVGPTATDVSNTEDYASDIETMSRLQVYAEKVLPCLKNATVVGSYTGLRPATEHRDYQIYSTKSREGAQWITVGGIRSTGLTASSGIGEYTAELYANLMHHSAVPTHASAGPEPESQQKPNTNYMWSRFFSTSSPRKKMKFDAGPDGLIGVSQCVANPLPLHDINRPLLPKSSQGSNKEMKTLSSRTEINNNVSSTIPPLSVLADSYLLRDNEKSPDNHFIGGSVELYGRRQRVTHAITSFGLETLTSEDDKAIPDEAPKGILDFLVSFTR